MPDAVPAAAAATEQTQSPPPVVETPAVPAKPSAEQVREQKRQASELEWQAAKDAALKSDVTVPKLGDGSVAAEEDEETETEEPVAGEGEPPPAEAALAKPEEQKPADETKPPTHKDWKKFRAWEHDAKKDIAKREARLAAREREIEASTSKTKAEVETELESVRGRIASVKGLDSDDPYEVWNALSKWKGWDPKESFSTVTQRTLHGGERSVQDQLQATEKKLLSEIEKRDEALKKERAELARERAEREAREAREHDARLVSSAQSEIAGTFKAALDAGKYRFLKRFTPEQASQIAYGELSRHYIQTSRKDASGRIIPGTGEEIPLDVYFNRFEATLKQEYETLHGLVSSESSRGGSDASGAGHGNGAAQAANPGTRDGNSPSQRKTPGTVTRNLAAQRSENGRLLSDAEEWEEAKRIAKQRSSATR